ncbi:hypothetical protein HK097_002130, partial [Rhizophlyctis rosea]
GTNTVKAGGHGGGGDAERGEVGAVQIEKRVLLFREKEHRAVKAYAASVGKVVIGLGELVETVVPAVKAAAQTGGAKSDVGSNGYNGGGSSRSGMVGGLYPELVSFHGTVKSKFLKDADQSQPFLPLGKWDLAKVSEKHNIGFGRADKVLCLRVGDEDGNDVDVYVDGRATGYAVGVLVGSEVRVWRAGLRCSGKGGKVYAVAVGETRVEVLGIGGGRVEKKEGDVEGGFGGVSEREACRLSNFYDGRKGVWRVRVSMTHLQFCGVWRVCGGCGVSMGALGGDAVRCVNGCVAEGGRDDVSLGGKARFFVEDGTTEGVVISEDLAVIFGVLGGGALGRAGVEVGLKKLVKRFGRVTYKKDPPWFGGANAEVVEEEDDENEGFLEEDGDDRVRRGMEDYLDVRSGEKWLQNVAEAKGVKRDIVLICGNEAGKWDGVQEWKRKRPAGDPVVPVDMLRGRTFKIQDGVSVATVAFPQLVLRCCEVEDVDVRGEAMKLLESLCK